MDDYVSLEPICDGNGYIVRYHENGGGYGSPYSFVCVAERVGDEWVLKAAYGEREHKFSVLAHRRIYAKWAEEGLGQVRFRRGLDGPLRHIKIHKRSNKMQRYFVRLELIITKGGEQFSGGSLWWARLKDDGLAAVTSAAQEAEAQIATLAKGTGPLTVQIMPTVVAMTGKSPDVHSQVFHGIPESALPDGYRAFMGIAQKLVELGDARVKAKHLD